MKPASKRHQGSVVATLWLTTCLTLPVLFFGNVILAQTPPPQNADVHDPFAVSIVPAPQVSSPQVRQESFQKLHLARKAVATRDIASAERLLQEVDAMQLTYPEKGDQPALVRKLIQDYRHLAEQAKTQGTTEPFRRDYAHFHLIQAETMLLRNELDLAHQLTEEAAKQQVQYSPNADLQPGVLFRRIEDARRAQSLASNSAPTQAPSQPLSQTAEEALKQAQQKLNQARQALEAGQFDQADRLARSAAAHGLSESAFPDGNTPNRLLSEIAARRQIAHVQPVIADSQSAVYHSGQDRDQVTQASTGNQPALAVPVPAIPPRTPYIDQQIEHRRAVLSQIASDIIQQLAEARRLCRDERKPDAALEKLHNLKRKVIETSQLDSTAKNAYVQQIDQAIEETVRFREDYSAQERQNRINEAVWAELRADREAFRNKEAQLAAMFREHKKFLDEQRYEEALRVAKKAKEFAPDDAAVQSLLITTQLTYNASRSHDIRDRKADGVVESLLAVDRASIIPDFERSPMLYTPNWAELTQRRTASNQALGYQRPENEKRILRQLEMPVTFNIDQSIPLEHALQLLCSQAGITYYLDRAALTEADVPTGVLIYMPIANAIMAKSVLNTILEQHGLAYTVENEMLNITSRKRAKGKAYTKMYYLGDIINEITPLPDGNVMEDAFKKGFREQDPNRHKNRQPGASQFGADGVPLARNGMPYSAESDPDILAQMGGMGGGMGGMGGGMGGMGGGMGGMGGGMGGMSGGMGGMGGSMGGMGGMGGGMGGMNFGSIIDIIQTVIEPESWQAFGVGGEGEMAFHMATQSVAIRQTEEIHAQIEDLLTQIRKMNDLQIAVEVRYITLSDSFYERMGTSFDMAFRNDNAMGRITQSQNNTVDPTDGTTQQTTAVSRGNNMVVGLSAPGVFTADASIPVTQDSFGIAIPTFGGYNPTAGISTGFAILSNIETYFFISAAQGDKRNSVMEAPKVMLQNGQPGMVNDTTEIPFVTSVTPVVADFAVSYQPIITMLNQGQVLRVQATVMNDRHHVKLVLNPTFSSLVNVQTFKYFGDDMDTEETETTRGDDTATTSTDPRSSSRRTTRARSGITIQQPVLANFSVYTTVSCPDGGTVLLGGIKRLSEGRIEAGVPILNKIPYIQRLFSNKAIGRDAQSVMIMVTPRIIIQEEEESFIMGNMGRALP